MNFKKKGGGIMVGLIGGLGYLSIVFGAIKSILEVIFYVSVIALSFKGIKAINIYINKSSE